MSTTHHHVIEQVPPDYYQRGVANNPLQRFWHTHKLQEVLRCIPYTSNQTITILDVGCASGWFLSKVQEIFPHGSCYGIDIYDKAITFGKRLYPRLKLRVADAQRIPYKAGFFNVIVCTEVLEHVDDPKQVLIEIKRVLKKNGIAVIELDSGSVLFSLVWYVWRKINGKVWNDAHLHSFTVKKLEKSVNESGFEIIAKKTFNFGMAMIFAIKKKENNH